MTLEILTMEQGSPEWHAAKVGIPSASNFSAILANGRGGAPSKTRLTYPKPSRPPSKPSTRNWTRW